MIDVLICYRKLSVFILILIHKWLIKIVCKEMRIHYIINLICWITKKFASTTRNCLELVIFVSNKIVYAFLLRYLIIDFDFKIRILNQHIWKCYMICYYQKVYSEIFFIYKNPHTFNSFKNKKIDLYFLRWLKDNLLCIN